MDWFRGDFDVVALSAEAVGVCETPCNGGLNADGGAMLLGNGCHCNLLEALSLKVVLDCRASVRKRRESVALEGKCRLDVCGGCGAGAVLVCV